jgi:predicted dehydrogenase
VVAQFRANEYKAKAVVMVNLGVVGVGWWGQKIIRTLQESGKIKVLAVSDPAPAAGARALCDDLDIRVLSTYDELLRTQDLDGVVLTTPNSLHEAQIIQAAKAGKHVFCEKPLALSLESAKRAVRSCLAHNVRLGLGHERRFEPPMKALRDHVTSGSLGVIQQIEGNFSQSKFLALDPGNWRLSKREAGCGPMTATGIHLLDLSTSLVGPADKVYATSMNRITGFESGDCVSAQIVFTSGVVGTINAMLATPFISRFAVYGTKGWIEVTDNSHVESPSGWVVTRSVSDDGIRTKHSEPVPPSNPIRDNLEAFADAIRTGQATYPITLQEMLDTTALLEAIARSADEQVVVTPGRADLEQWESRAE